MARRSLFTSTLLLIALGACSEPSLTIYEAPKDSEETLLPAQEPAGSIRWQAPAGWRKRPAQGMRLATYLIPAKAGDGELSIVRLAGEAGGDLANVNRWRGQLELPPLESLDGQVQRLASAAGEVRWVDFAAAQDKRMLGAILTDGSASLFFKLTGPKKTVAETKPAFLSFLRSLRRGGS